MSRPDEIARRRAEGDDNCDVAVRDARTGVERVVPGFIPVFAGVAILGSFAAASQVKAGDTLRRLPDGKCFRVAQVLREMPPGRMNVILEIV